MATLVDSEASFVSRAAAIGIDEELVQKLLAAGINSSAKLAFSCNYNPQATDEQPLIDMVTNANGGTAVTLGQMACVRRLFFEAHTMVLADLKSQVEKTDDQGPRKVPAPERAARYEAQQKRLPGLDLSGELEPAHALIDAVMQQAEDQQLKYLPPHKCPKRESELQAVKSDTPVMIDTSAGKFLVGKQVKEVPCDTTTELKTLWAFQRRGLAYDQADLIRWATHDSWLKELFSHLTRPAPPGFNAPTLNQLIRADRELFTKMAELTRTGITARPDGTLPLDKAMKDLMFSAVVQFHLLPLPGSASKQVQQTSSTEQYNKRGAPSSTSEPSKRFKGGKSSKGGGKGKSRNAAPAMPAELRGMYYKTKDGKSICFAYNMPSGCSNSDGHCPKGMHVCCKPGCQKPHPMKEHRD